MMRALLYTVLSFSILSTGVVTSPVPSDEPVENLEKRNGDIIYLVTCKGKTHVSRGSSYKFISTYPPSE
jgi:hypothetical protein